MKIIKWKIGDNKPIVEDQLAVAIGNFDGIHQGHIKLLNECKIQAKADNLSFGVVTFDPHPRDFFNPKNPSFKLLDAEEKETLLCEIGVKHLIIIEFNEQLKNCNGEDLIKAIATSYETQLRLSLSIALNPNRIDHVGHLGPAITSGIGNLLKLDTETIYQAIQWSAHTSTFTRQGRKGKLSSWKAYAPGLVGKNSIDAIDRAMRGDTSPSPVWEGDYGIIQILLKNNRGEIKIELPESNEPRQGILNTFTKEHSAGYHGNSLIDLAFEMRKKVTDTKEIKKINIFTKEYTHVVMGSGSNDKEKYSSEASRETLDHSAMYIFAVALEDGKWHHEESYAESRKKRKETVELWNKIETFESSEWNQKYYNEVDPLKKAQGAKVEIIFNNGDKIVDQLDFANAHPNGKTPFVRENYLNKMKKLFTNIVDEKEEKRFINLIDNLGNLTQDEVKRLNINCKNGYINLDKNKIKGIF